MNFVPSSGRLHCARRARAVAHLRLHIDESHVNREYRLWGGCSADLDRGEILSFSP
jgi:hypothetical protein